MTGPARPGNTYGVDDPAVVDLPHDDQPQYKGAPNGSSWPSRMARRAFLMVTRTVWLVGFTFRSDRDRPVRHFYVVPEAADAAAARESALRRARTTRERALRGGLDVDEATAETRRLFRDCLGVWRLGGRGPSPDEPSGFPSAA